jgi:hypothetical protein
MVDSGRLLWVFLVERGLEAGSDVQLFWHESDALAAARLHLSRWWPVEELGTADDIAEAIEASNQVAGREEYLTLEALPIVGNQFFEGDVDRRPRCAACREPIELADRADPDSWVHCEDANDLGDHTAERDAS